MSYLYSRVVCKLWFDKTPVLNSTSAKMAILSRKKATLAVIAVSIIFVICWVPVLVMYSVAQSLPSQMVYSPTHKITIVLAMFNSSINPVVYSFTSARFRQHLMKLLNGKCSTR
ncbi:allatostatin-A receptor-like [Oculina patagonica]